LYFSSCSNKAAENLSVYRTLALSINNSRAFISNQNQYLEKSFEEKLLDPQTRQQALMWYPPAKLAKSLTSQVVDYIDSLKMLLKQEAGLKIISGVETFREDDREAVYSLFNKKGNGEKLFQLLSKFRNNLLAINPEIMLQFKSSLNTTIVPANSNEGEQKAFTETFFENIPAIGAITVLCELQNNVKIAENEIMTFCNYKIPNIDHSYFKI
jgi:hypothetical protein